MIRVFLFLFVFLFSTNIFGLDVDETIKNTINNNSKIRIALEKLNESKELIEKATGAKLPTVTSTISGTYSKSDKKTTTAETTPETFTDLYKITITQNLYDAGSNDLEIERSKILYNDEIINFQIIIQDLILDAITGYLTVINYEKSLEATTKNYELVLKGLEEIKTRHSLGSATLYELQSGESSFAIVKANLFAAEQNLKISKKSFKRIVGLDPYDLEDVVNINLDQDISSIMDIAKNNNLSLKLLSNNVKNNEILLLKEKLTKKPTLDFTGTAEYSDAGRIDSGTEEAKGSLSLTLTVPLYQQGIDDSNIRKYQSQILQSEIEYEDFLQDLMINISNTLKDFNISKANMISNQTVIKTSETALISLKEEYDIGTKTINDILEEEEKLLSSNVEFLNSKKDYLINYFKIKSLEGTLLNIFQNYLPTIN
tara:strand:+ start:806 stop:2092 length:1287 start_codon:yes stop_codon:yes gene_type:complete